MQIILLDKEANLGSLGDQVNVKSGYARNYLIHRVKLFLRLRKTLSFSKRVAELEAKLAETLAAAEARAAKINALGSVTISSKSG